MKNVLNVNDDYDFSLLGISCHAKDYRLCWEINKALNVDLEKQHYIFSEKQSDKAFSNAAYFDEENHIDYVLISNKNEGGVLIPEHSQLDYFIKIQGPQHEFIAEDSRSALLNIDFVLAVVELNPSELKSKMNLIF
ncbi:MAG TPA: IPExxxVDY family protein [Flavobacteriales bacterium]|nr:IPExxxVDY family protein [Flavobacteriales bacterium]